MSVNGINSNSFDFSKLLGDKATTPATGSAGAVDFSSALKLQMASIQSLRLWMPCWPALPA